jgi:hypothetical protein
MNALRSTAFIAALLLSAAPTFAEDAHHPQGSAPETPGATAPAPAPDKPAAAGMMQMMAPGMMQMMTGMSGEMCPMMGASGGMAMMMAPEHVEGRIAFLRIELGVSEAQQPLWDAVADALRANALAAGSMAEGMMPMDPGPGTPVQKLALYERALSARLEGLVRLRAAVEPFYAALSQTQKELADKLLMPAPTGMM